jgi:hypothetical protein
MRRAFAACSAVAALSLLLPSAPSFDPWAWIVWGREAWQLDLDTNGGPSWKPLPVLFTAAFAPLGALSDGLPPALWLVVARTGALLSLVLAFRLTRRLAGPGRWTGLGAGAIAALALALSPQWLRYAAHGNEVPVAVALMLWGVERHLDGERDQALTAAFVACLMRPEVFPFLAAYGVWTWRLEPGSRRLVAGLALALPALWIVPDWIGSGNPLSAGQKASSEPSWSLSLRDQPWLAALGRAHRIAGLPLELGTVVAVAFAAVRRDRRTLALAAVAAAWLALVVAMTEAGFSGSSRYFVPAIVIACVLTGLAAAWTVQAVARAGTLAGASAVVTIAVVALPALDTRFDRFERQWLASAELARLQDGLVDALESAGGSERVIAAGTPSVNRGFMPRLAWETGLTLLEVEDARGDGLVFTTRGSPFWGRSPERESGAGSRRVLARVGAWEVLGPPLTLAAVPRDRSNLLVSTDRREHERVMEGERSGDRRARWRPAGP